MAEAKEVVVDAGPTVPPNILFLLVLLLDGALLLYRFANVSKLSKKVVRVFILYRCSMIGVSN